MFMTDEVLYGLCKQYSTWMDWPVVWRARLCAGPFSRGRASATVAMALWSLCACTVQYGSTDSCIDGTGSHAAQDLNRGW